MTVYTCKYLTWTSEMAGFITRYDFKGSKPSSPQWTYITMWTVL